MSDGHLVGVYRITGALDGNGSTETALATGPDGTQVVITFLDVGHDPDGSAARRALDEAEVLRRIPSAGVARVLDARLHEGRPYLVTEYVEGPTLAQRVDAEGPLRGDEPHRLALATVTALSAIHRSGFGHPRVSPDDIVLAEGGARLIGLRPFIPPAAGAVTRPAVSIGFSAPERLRAAAADRPDPASDLFSWAACVVYAVTGRPPFGTTPTEVVARLDAGADAVAPADLAAVGPGLLQVVSACLSPDPGRRPTADEVLLRLVGQNTSQVARHIGRPEGTTPARSWRRPGWIAAGAVVLALAAGGAALLVAAPWEEPERRRSAAPARSSPAAPATSAAPKPDVVLPATRKVELPDLGAVLNENPDDPVLLAGYLAPGTEATYVRDADGDSFGKTDDLYQPVRSPDGKWTAMVSWAKFGGGVNTDHVRFVSQENGEQFDIEVGEKPVGVVAPVWSRDSGRVLLTFYDSTPGASAAQGFVIANLMTRTAYEVPLGKGPDVSSFTWSADGKEVVRVGAPDPKRPSVLRAVWYSDTGRELRRSPEELGPTVSRGNWFSPSGDRYFAVCSGTPKNVCVYDARTSRRLAVVPTRTSEDVAKPQAWFGEEHLLVVTPRGRNSRYEVIGFDGEVRRVLADIPTKRVLDFLMDFASTP